MSTKKQTNIIPDSLSLLQALEHLSLRSSPVVQNIAIQLENFPSPVQVAWTPGHVGIDPNEKADALSRSKQINGSVWQSILPNDVTNYQRNLDIQKHAERITTTIGQRYAVTHIDPTHRWHYQHCSSRQYEIAFCRLRTNTCLNSFLYSRHLNQSPNCPHCNTQETPFHFWIECAKYVSLRTRLSTKIGINVSTTTNLETLYWPQHTRNISKYIQALEQFIYATHRL